VSLKNKRGYTEEEGTAAGTKRLKTKAAPVVEDAAVRQRLNRIALVLIDRGLPLGAPLARLVASYVEDFGFNTRQLYAWEQLCMQKNVCVLGSSGSGKTFACSQFATWMHTRFVKEELCKMPQLRARGSLLDMLAGLLTPEVVPCGPVLRVGPSGQAVANMGAGSRTIHNQCGIYPGPSWLDPVVLEKKRKQLLGECARYEAYRRLPDRDPERLLDFASKPGPLLQRARLMWVDEISMVEYRLALTLDSLLRSMRGSSEVMGGVQLLISGDWAQIPPVLEKEMRDKGHRYHPLLFEYTDFWNSLRLATVPLRQNFRQGEGDFQRALNAIRLHNRADFAYQVHYTPLDPWVIEFFRARSRTVLQVKAWLKSMACKNPNFIPPLFLAPRNDEVDQWNREQVAELRTKQHVFRSSAYVIKTVKSEYTKPDGKRGTLVQSYWAELSGEPPSAKEKAQMVARSAMSTSSNPNRVRVTVEWKNQWNKAWKEHEREVALKEKAPVQSRSNVDLVKQQIGNRKRCMFIGPLEGEADAKVKLPVISVHASGVAQLQEVKAGFRPSAPKARVMVDGEIKNLNFALKRYPISDDLDLGVWYLPISYCFAATYDSTQSLNIPEGVVLSWKKSFQPAGIFVALGRATDISRVFIIDFDAEMFGPDPETQKVFCHPSAFKFYKALEQSPPQASASV
jgi:hypothetical protein